MTTRASAADDRIAELPERGAAFLIDALLASVFVFIAASLIGWWINGRYLFADQPELLLLVQVVAALACVLPTALAAYWWHRHGATPGQRLLGLRVLDARTGERLAFGAAFARWVLLFAPLTLLLAYPHIALFDPFPFLFLVMLREMPWLPLATMAVASMWYLALAYPALADRAAGLGLHDRVVGSVVLRQPDTGARARPRRGRAADLGKLVPFSWFARSRLPWYGWLLIAAAVAVAVVAVFEVVEQARLGANWVWIALLAAGAVGTVLLPVALLWRVPSAAQRYPLLLIGLALAAVAVALRYVLGPVASDILPLSTLGGSIDRPLAVLAPLVVALGLLAMRPGGATRPPLFVLLVAVYLFVPVATLVGLEYVAGDVVAIGGSIVAALAGAFGAWVVLGAWLDREAPRVFWALLALTIALGFAQIVAVMSMRLISDPAQAAALQPLVLLFHGACGAAIAGLSIVAYGRFAQRD